MSVIRRECHSCGSPFSRTQDLLLQPISTSYLSSASADDPKFPLAISQCSICHLVQLSSYPSVSERPAVPSWISFTEPEDHVDLLCSEIEKDISKGSATSILGISSYDRSTLTNLGARGFGAVKYLDPKFDAKSPAVSSNLESLQDEISSGRFDAGSNKFQCAVIRRLFEHVEDPPTFLSRIRPMLSKNALVVIEVPDSSRIFKFSDYSFVWENHVSYFTESTLNNCLTSCGLRVEKILRYPYLIEDSLVAFGRFEESSSTQKISYLKNSEFFEASIDELRINLKKKLIPFDRKVAVFGAGHQAVRFINMFQIADYISAVFDDDKNKSGLYLAGSHLPIQSSEGLKAENYRLCLLTVNPAHEEKIISKFNRFTDAGGEFASALRPSSRALKLSLNLA